MDPITKTSVQIYKNSHVAIFYNQVQEMVIQKWSKEYFKEADFTEALNQTLELFKNNGAKKLFSDTREQPFIERAGSNYAASVVTELVSLGMEKMAFLTSGDTLPRIGVINFINAAKDLLL